MRRLFQMFLLLLALTLAGSGQASEGAPILQEIRFEGLERVEADSVLYYSQLEVGEPYTDRAGREDFKRLWETGFFDELWLEKEESIDGVVLTWHVVERPRLNSITYEGNDKLATEDVREGSASCKKRRPEWKNR